MRLREIREFLLPTEAERDEGFRAQVERLGRRALRIIGCIEIVMPILAALVYFTWLRSQAGAPFRIWMVLTSIILGMTTYWSAGTWWGGQHSRLVAVASGLGSVALGTWSSFYMVSEGIGSQLTGSLTILVVLLVGLAILPAKPWHVLALGASSSFFYRYWAGVAVEWGWLSAEQIPEEEFVTLPLIVLLCTVLMAVNYDRLYRTYRSHQESLRAADELRRSEARALIAESAASMGRLAAAVSHELNSPLGAVKSAAGSLAVMIPRIREADSEERPRLLELTSKLTGTISRSSERMSQIVERMQRFANLDRAEVQPVDMNQLLRDVAALIQGQDDRRVSIRLVFGALPLIPCRPQPLSAVFSGLLHEAAESAGESGEVQITTECIEPDVRISVAHSGPPLTAKELERMFDPKFRISSGRVTTGNWSLFSARRLLEEQGGSIRAQRRLGGGATFIVKLPCPVEAA